MRGISVAIMLAMLVFSVPQSTQAWRLWSGGAELKILTEPASLIDHVGEMYDFGTTATSSSIKHSGTTSWRANPSTNHGAFNQSFGDVAADVLTPVYVRFYIYVQDLPSERVDIFGFMDYQLTQVSSMLNLNPDGTLTWATTTSATTATTLATSTETLSPDTWYRIEVGYDAGSNVTVRLDGTEVINTTPGGNVGVGAFLMGACVSSWGSDQGGDDGLMCGADHDTTADFYFDDVAVNNSLGTAQNSWPGDGSIVILRVNASGDNDDANPGDCTGVDDPIPDLGVTSATMDNANDILECNVESASDVGLAGTEDITLVQVGVYSAQSDTSQASAARTRIKSASLGTVHQSDIRADTPFIEATYHPNFISNFTAANYATTSYTDPTTGIAWTQSGTNSLNNMQIGLQATDVTPTIVVDFLWALVEYTAGTPASVTFTRKLAISDSTTITGSVSKGSGTFVIDHPLKPKRHLLYHSFVESPDVKNFYDGIVTLNKRGEVTIALPGYFLPLNKDFRYLATPIGVSMPNLHISGEIRKRWFGLFGKPVFTIAGGTPHGEVSWQVTGVRHDPYIEAHPVVTEVEKTERTHIKKGECVFAPLCE